MELKTWDHKVQYYETDGMRIVHHSNYIRWMEEARMYAMDQMGMGYEVLEANGITIPVVSVACNYLNMSRYGETVEIAAAMASYNGVRMRITYEIRDKATGQLRATGETTHCFLAENGQPVVLKKHFPEGDAMFRMLLKISKQSQK